MLGSASALHLRSARQRHWDHSERGALEGRHFLRDDFAQKGETATLRRVSTLGGIGVRNSSFSFAEAHQEHGLRRRAVQAARLRLNTDDPPSLLHQEEPT